MGADNSFRRSDNIEDRRKEHFQSFPQAAQAPNVFLPDGLMAGMAKTDFAPVPPANQLSTALGSPVLDQLMRQYFLDRGNSMAEMEKSPQLFDLFK